MARHNVEQVLVVDRFGQRNAAGAFLVGSNLGMQTDFLNPIPPAIPHFRSPVQFTPGVSDVGNNTGERDLAVMEWSKSRAFEFTGLATLPNPNPAFPNQRGYFPNFSALRFATYDPILGSRMSDKIAYDRINRIWGRGPALKTPQISVFHLAFNTPGVGNPIITYKGQSAAISVDIRRNHTEWNKQPLFAQVYVGGQVTTNSLGTPNTNIPATGADIQKAHFDLLEQILDADIALGGGTYPNGLYFDARSSRLLSASSGYSAIYLVGAFKPVFQTDFYAEFNVNLFDVSLISGFQNPIYATAFDPAELAGSYAANRSYLLKQWLYGDPGSGYPEQVRWHERRVAGQLGQSSHIHYPLPDNFLVNMNRFYSSVHIEYEEHIRQTGENGTKHTHKELTIYMSTIDARGLPTNTYATPAQWNAPDGPIASLGTGFSIGGGTTALTAINDPFAVSNVIPTRYTYQNLFSSNPLIVSPAIKTNMDLVQDLTNTSLLAYGNGDLIGGPTNTIIGANPNQFVNPSFNPASPTQTSFFQGTNSNLLGGGVPIAGSGNDFISNMNLALMT